MIIENPDAFKSWLTSILEPLCDADPAALAKYVYALVKKDKPLEELRDGMLDQLDVFLQQETKPFVDMLFKSLECHDYLKPSAEPREPSPQPELLELPELEKQSEQENHVIAAPPPMVEKPPVRRSPPHRVVMPRVRQHPHHEQTLVKVLPTELLEEPVDAPRRRDRRNDSVREKDDRRRRRSRSWERRARRRRSSRSPSPRGRYRNRSPPTIERHNSRSRSRSPVPIRDRDLERERERLRPLREIERDRMSRDREHRDRLSRSRDRERSRDRSISPHETRLEHTDVFKRRCRDFDVKGYCMRGDQCEWDHGADPVVLEDATLTRVLAAPPALTEYNPAAPDIWSGSVAPAFPPPPHHLAPRELVPIPRVRHEPPLGASMPPPPRQPPPPKKNFDYNRLGTSRPPFSSNANCSLEVKKVPRGLNDITHLNNHFCKFGKIVNIQVSFEGDPEAALITFSNPTEANVAYKSTEAVLNNRFIKVFWHNPENKQENTAPPGQQANKQMERQNSHPMSHNKVLINRDNMKATADNKIVEKNAKEQSNGTEAPAKANAKQLSEHHRRAHELLQSQLRQQKLMIQKLEAGSLTDTQRAALLDAVKASHDGVEKLREQLVAYNGMRAQLQASIKKPKTAQEAQKEILDAELDIITKQQEGHDVSELSLRIAALRRAAAALAPRRTNRFSFYTTSYRILRRKIRGGRFNPAMRFTRASKGFSVNQSVDHRPRALLVSGFEGDELDALLAHFSQFGEITGKEVNLSVPELVVQYRVRQHAEHAMHAARNYSDRTLSITWMTSSKPLNAPILNGDSGHDDKDDTRATRLDEDEEDEEHRSWRR